MAERRDPLWDTAGVDARGGPHCNGAMHISPLASGALAVAAVVGCAAPSSTPRTSPPTGGGPVVAVGGGGTPDGALEVMLELAGADGGREVAVLVIPNASQREDRGVGSAEMFREAGAATAAVMADDPAEAAAQVAASDIVWMSGGDQDRLLDDLERMGLVDDVRAAHERGAVVGGTSAGAAVLGSRTIAGSPEPAAYTRGALPGRPGLGLLPDLVVDQHFAERRREGRLLTALIDAPESLAIGVGEGTAAVFEGDSFRVVGRGVVLRFDASDVETQVSSGDARQRARGIRVDVFAPADARQPLRD